MRACPRRVNGTAGDHNVGATVIVEIDKTRTPLHGSSFAGEASGNGYIREETLTFVVIEAGHFVGEIRLDDIEEPVTIVVDGVSAHATLRAAVCVVGHSGQHSALAKSAVAVVHEQQAGGGIVGDIDIGPAIVIIVGYARSET